MPTGNINDAELQKFLEVAGQMGIRVLLTHGDGWLPPVDTLGELPTVGNTSGDIRVVAATGVPYRYNGTAWEVWNIGGTVAWGGITGTLSAQTDLQNALNAKMGSGAYVLVSRDSALSNQVNLGSLSTGVVKITVTAGVATVSIATKADIGLGNVDNTSDANKPVSTAQAAANTTTLNSAKSYADSLVVGLLDDRGNYNASVNTFPATGGSGTAGAVLKGDLWTISVAGTLGGVAVTAGDVVRAIVDTPGQTTANWAISENNIGYVAENSVNKATTMTGNTADNVKYLSAKAIYDWANPLIAARELLSNKATVLSTSNDTLYPTVKAVVDALALKANDSAVVHIAGTETITGTKLFVDPRFNTTLPSGVASVLGTSNNPLVNIYANYGTGTEVATYLGATLRLDLRDTAVDPIFQVRKKPATKLTADSGGDIKIFAVGGNGNVQVFGSVGIGTESPSTYLEIFGNGSPGGIVIKSSLNKKVVEFGMDGAYQRAAYQYLIGNSQTDNSAMRFATFVDRDSAIVGVDTYQIWGYPIDNAGTILDYAPLVQYNYNRVNQKMSVNFPRSTDNFQIGNDDIMNDWLTYTPVVSGSGGGAVTSYGYQHGAYKKIGKKVDGWFSVKVTDKGSLSGSVQVSLPPYSVNSTQANKDTPAAGFMGQPGANPVTASRGIPVLSTTQCMFLLGIDTTAVTWSVAVNGDIMRASFTYWTA